MKPYTDYQKLWLCQQAYVEPPEIDQTVSIRPNTETWLQRRRRELAKTEGE